MLEYLNQFENNSSRFGIRLMDNNNQLDINLFFELFYDCFGHRSQLNKVWFNWYYNKNPLGKCNNYLLFDIGNNKLVGAYGFAKISYTYGFDKIIGVLGVNGFIHKDYTKKGLYTELMNFGLLYETKRNLAFSFPHGNNIASVKGHIKSNWKLFEELNFFEKTIGKKKLQKPNSINLLSDDFSSINFDIFKKESFSFIKNKDFLKWRYTDRRYRNYTILGYQKNDDILAYMILGKYVNKDNVVRAQIVDFNSVNTDVFNDLLQGAEYFAQNEKADKIDLILGLNSNYSKCFVDNSFKKTDELYKLMIYPNIDEPISNALLGDFDAV